MVGRGRGSRRSRSPATDPPRFIATAIILPRTAASNRTRKPSRASQSTWRLRACFAGGQGRSNAAALRWADVSKPADACDLWVQVPVETDQEGPADNVRYLMNGAATAVWARRPQVPEIKSSFRARLGRAVGERRRTAAARAVGIEGRITGRSGRFGLAAAFTARGASTTETIPARGWTTAHTHYTGAAAEKGGVAVLLQGLQSPSPRC